MVLGGILKVSGHSVEISRDLQSRGGVTLLSLFSSLQLLDPKVRDFAASQEKIYVGGPVSLCPEMVMGELDIDAVVIGEGEEVVADLVESGPEGLPGVAYRRDGGIVKSEPRPVASLDHPLPLVPDDIGGQSVRGANVYIETHRGCLGGCSFCQVPRFFGRTIRSRSLENVLEEVRELRRHGVRRVAVSGGTGSLFGYRGKVDRGAFIELISSLSEVVGKKNLSVPDMRVDMVDGEVLEAVKEHTIGWVFFGLESGSNRVLRAMRKGVSVRDNLRAVELARSLGVKVGGSFIVGYPTETRREFEETVSLVEEAMLDDVFVSVAEPIPGTPLASEVLSIDKEDNALYQDHEGEYSALKLSEAEARCFELMLHGEICKPLPRAISDELYRAYLREARSQGSDIRKVTELVKRYGEFLA
jgi:B12-binding domain/radical SAM domain protein